MSKKDYIAIANIVRESQTAKEVGHKLTELFASENPRFNEKKFKMAIGEQVGGFYGKD